MLLDRYYDYSSEDNEGSMSYWPSVSKRRPSAELTESASKKNIPQVANCSPDTDLDTINEILYGKFFRILRKLNDSDSQKKRGGIQVECRICQKKLQGFVSVSSNFIRHLRTKHAAEFKLYEELKSKVSDPRTKHSYSEDTLHKLTLKLLAHNMLPISLVENKAFHDFVGYLNPRVKITSVAALQRTIDELHASMQIGNQMEIETQSCFCATIDVWTSEYGSLLALTCHWLNSEFFERRSIALACRRLHGSLTYESLKISILEVLAQYNLDTTKIRAIATHNGTNFTQTFRELGVECVQASSEGAELTELTELLAGVNCLPKQLISATHTLTLIASVDFLHILKENVAFYGKHKNLMWKCSYLWSRTYASNDQMLPDVKLKYPLATRWNSLYDALKALLAQSPQSINQICMLFGIEQFLEEDFKYMQEYVQVMQPLADAIDFLQNDKSMIYGFLLPTLATVRAKYHRILSYSTLLYFNHVLPQLVQTLQARFESYFQLKEDVNDAIVAAVLCPAVKLQWIRALNPSFDDAKITEINELVKKCIADESNSVAAPPAETVQYEQFPYFDFSLTEEPATSAIPRALENDYCNFLANPSTSKEILHKYPAIKATYLKYNTPVTSSAAVERFFPLGTLKNAINCGGISDANFEKLLLLKANGKV